MDAMNCAGLADGVIKSRRLRVHRLPIDHARVIDKHHCLPLAVYGDGIEAIAADQRSNFIERNLIGKNRLTSVGSDH